MQPLLNLAKKMGKADGNLFNFGLPKLVEIGLIASAADMDASNPNSIISQVIHLADIAGEDIWGLFYMGFPEFTKGDSPIFTKEELKQNFKVTKGSWLESCAHMSKEGGFHVWSFFLYGFTSLVGLGVLRKNHLDEDMRYAPGSLSYEMARIPASVGKKSWDYFEVMMPDCLARFETLTAQNVAQFFKDTAGPARLFYESGNDMTWEKKVRQFPSLLPLEDPAGLLTVLGEVRKNPSSKALMNLLKSKRGWHLDKPRHLADVQQVGRYSEFLLVLTQKGEDKENYLKNLDLSLLTTAYQNKKPAEIVQVAEILNNLQPSDDRGHGGLGDRWLADSRFSVANFQSGMIAVNLDNLDEVYATYYILKRSNAAALKDIKFEWKNGVARRVSVGDLSRIILTSHRLTTLFGENDNPLKSFFSGLKVDSLALDMADIPKEFFEASGLEKVRFETNKYTNNIGGDQFVLLLGQAVTTAPMSQVGIDNMIEAMNGWSRIEKISSSDSVKDIQGRYLLLARHAASRVRDYFETNPEELRLRADRTEILTILKRLERSVRPQVEVEVPALRVPVARSGDKKTANGESGVWPSTTGVPRQKHGAVAASPPADPTLAWLERMENEGLSLGEEKLNALRLDNPSTFAPLRAEIAQKTTAARADRLVHRIYERFFRNKIDLNNYGEYFAIVKGLNNHADPIFHLWGDFAGGKLVQFLRNLPEADYEKVPQIKEMTAWLLQTGFIDKKDDDMKKFADNIKAGNYGYAFRKGWAKTGGRLLEFGDGISGDMKGTLKLEKISGELPGYDIQKIMIGGRHMATLITGDPKAGAKAGIRIKPGAGASYEAIEKQFGNRLQYHGPVLMVSPGNKGIEVMVENGDIVNFVFDPTRLDGYLIIYPNGRIHIADKRNLSLYELTKKSEDRSVRLDLNDPKDFQRFFDVAKEQKLSIVASLLFKNTPGEQYAKNAGSQDSRRFVVEFADGRFGLLDSEGIDFTINDLLSIAWRIPGVVRAAYCDTGMYDMASYFLYPNGPDGRREKVILGHRDTDKSSNRLYFYSEGKK